MSETTRDTHDDAFTLFDLRVDVIATDRPMVCNHQAGDYFTLRGENLEFPPVSRSRCIRWRRSCRCCPPSSVPRIPMTG